MRVDCLERLLVTLIVLSSFCLVAQVVQAADCTSDCQVIFYYKCSSTGCSEFLLMDCDICGGDNGIPCDNQNDSQEPECRFDFSTTQRLRDLASCDPICPMNPCAEANNPGEATTGFANVGWVKKCR